MFYYGHPQNRFWQVLSSVLNTKTPVTNKEKKEFLLENKIALWDVLKTCEIKGAEDNSIKNPVVNDINLLIKNSNITKVFTTGRTAWNIYKKYSLKDTKTEAVYLPSTSPANCRISLTELIDKYKIILNYL